LLLVEPERFAAAFPTDEHETQLIGRSNMPEQDRNRLNTLRAQLLEHPVYAEVASVQDLRA
jgi:hypothetical protein